MCIFNLFCFQFLQDLYSGKLHREFHYGPDPSTTSDEPNSQDIQQNVVSFKDLKITDFFGFESETFRGKIICRKNDVLHEPMDNFSSKSDAFFLRISLKHHF